MHSSWDHLHMAAALEVHLNGYQHKLRFKQNAQLRCLGCLSTLSAGALDARMLVQQSLQAVQRCTHGQCQVFGSVVCSMCCANAECSLMPTADRCGGQMRLAQLEPHVQACLGAVDSDAAVPCLHTRAPGVSSLYVTSFASCTSCG